MNKDGMVKQDQELLDAQAEYVINCLKKAEKFASQNNCKRLKVKV